MKKLLITILIILLGFVVYFMLFNGLEIMKIKVLSMEGIQTESDRLDTTIENAKTKTSVEFPSKEKELANSLRTLLQEKQSYEDVLNLTSLEEISLANRSEEYEIEFLWTIVGNHATKNNVEIKMDITSSSTGLPNMYDLSFTVNGSYIGITDFIYALENDTSLEFRIDRFSLLPSQSSSGTTNDTAVLTSTFTVTDVYINISNTSSASSFVPIQNIDETEQMTDNTLTP